MKFFLALIALACSAMLSAQPLGERAVSDKEAQIQFWKSATCFFERDETKVMALLTRKASREERQEATRELVDSHKECIKRGGALRMTGFVLRNALAAAYVAKTYKDKPMPDFSAIPQMYRISGLPADATDKQKMRRGLYQFVECVVRADSKNVVMLLSEEPFSAAETRRFTDLQPTMGSCLPVQQGIKLGFTRLELRSTLGRVAFRLADRAAKLPNNAKLAEAAE